MAAKKTTEHGLLAKNSSGRLYLYREHNLIRSRAFVDRYGRRDLIEQWTAEVNRMHRYDTYSIVISLNH